jgi:bifunctional DNA-binding transcriptional regulator/antitoxin component of YhaV-PrlF toxin-antitoxin module
VGRRRRIPHELEPADVAVKLRAKALLAGKTATGIVVPDAFVDALGGGHHPKVRATVNGEVYRGSIVRMGGRFMLGLPAEFRERAGIAAGDTLDLDIVLDDAPRVVELPAELKRAMAKDAAAKRGWKALSYTKQREIALAIEGAKKPETRARRVDKALAELRQAA